MKAQVSHVVGRRWSVVSSKEKGFVDMQPTTTTPSDLSVAEALILQDPNATLGRSALKLTMMDLLARRVLTLEYEETKGRFGRTHKTDKVIVASDAARQFAHQPHVQAVINAIVTAGKHGEPPSMQQVIASAGKAFGHDLAGFKREHVIPRLTERGLLRTTTQKVLFIFSKTRYIQTEAGQAAVQRIQAQVAQARNIPTLLDQGNRAEVAALVVGLGASLLLVDELRPHYSRLSQALRRPATDGGGGDTGGDVPDDDTDVPEQPGEMGADFDAVDFGGFDLNAFDSLDSSLDAFDSSFDSSADSGGSDGGGDSGGSSD